MRPIWSFDKNSFNCALAHHSDYRIKAVFISVSAFVLLYAIISIIASTTTSEWLINERRTARALIEDVSGFGLLKQVKTEEQSTNYKTTSLNNFNYSFQVYQWAKWKNSFTRRYSSVSINFQLQKRIHLLIYIAQMCKYPFSILNHTGNVSMRNKSRVNFTFTREHDYHGPTPSGDDKRTLPETSRGWLRMWRVDAPIAITGACPSWSHPCV